MKALLELCPPEMDWVKDHLEGLEYYTKPKYGLIRRAFKAIGSRLGASDEDPFDWEDGGAFHGLFDERARQDAMSMHSRSTASSPTDSTEASLSDTTESYEESTTTNQTTTLDTSWAELHDGQEASEPEDEAAIDEKKPAGMNQVRLFFLFSNGCYLLF